MPAEWRCLSCDGRLIRDPVDQTDWWCMGCCAVMTLADLTTADRAERRAELDRLRAVGLPGAADWLERAREGGR